jgi:hypothetical protein
MYFCLHLFLWTTFASSSSTSVLSALCSIQGSVRRPHNSDLAARKSKSISKQNSRYAKAKQSAPHHTSTIFVAPLFNHFHSTLLDNKGIQRVKTIAKGQKRPGISAPLPYAVAVYSDNTIPQPNLSMFETTYLTQVSHGQLLPSFATVTCLAYSGVSYAFLQPII